MKKVFLTAVVVLFLSNLSFSRNYEGLNNKNSEDCGLDCIGLALNIDQDAGLSFEEFEAVIHICEAFNLIGCN